MVDILPHNSKKLIRKPAIRALYGLRIDHLPGTDRRFRYFGASRLFFLPDTRAKGFSDIVQLAWIDKLFPGVSHQGSKDFFLEKSSRSRTLIFLKRNHIRFFLTRLVIGADQGISGTVKNNFPGSHRPCFFPVDNSPILCIWIRPEISRALWIFWYKEFFFKNPKFTGYQTNIFFPVK